MDNYQDAKRQTWGGVGMNKKFLLLPNGMTIERDGDSLILRNPADSKKKLVEGLE